MLIPCVLAVYLPKARPFRGPQILQARPGSDERLDFMRLSIYGLVYDRNISSIVITSYMILSIISSTFGWFWFVYDESMGNIMAIMGYWFSIDQPKYHENIFVGISSDVDYGILIHHEPTKKCWNLSMLGYMGYWSIWAENKPTKTGILMLGYCGNDVPILMVVNWLLATLQ